MYGYLGRLLYIDLSTGKWDTVFPDSEDVRNHIGGRGLGARCLRDLLPSGAAPLDPENVAILMNGPFTGTRVYACHKYEWVTKSPLTGTYLCSNCGGMLGVNLRKAGYDGLILTGAAERPVYLFVDESGPKLREAADLWGKTVSQTQAILHKQIPSAAVGCIGPAAEPPHAVRFAGFFDGQRSAGRGGLGAVFGSKRLKAIAVAPGRAEVPIYDPEALDQLLPKLARQLKKDRIAGDALPQVGSMIWMDALALNGLLPTRNYQASVDYAQIRGRLDSEAYRKLFTKSHPRKSDLADASCYRCPLQSAKLCIPDGADITKKPVRGPEFQSAWALGVNCGVFDYPPLIAAYTACNDHGVDAISLGGVIGFAMECCQRNLLNRRQIEKDYDGLCLEWGNCEAVLRMIGIVARRKGWLGDLLGDGVREASKRIPGSAEFALHVKGMEFPGYDPRGYWSMALAYATSCRGACHLKSWSLDAQSGPTASTEGQAARIIWAENARAVVDSALICTFAGEAITKEWIVALLAAVTGLHLSDRDIDACGARICDLERRLALCQGMSAQDDDLPQRILNEPICGGDCDGLQIGRPNFERMLREYYAIRGWDERGVPAAEMRNGMLQTQIGVPRFAS